MEKNQDNKGTQPTDTKVYQPVTGKEANTETPSTDQTNNPAINKGKQQNSLQENNPQQKDPSQGPAKKITDTPEKPKREADPITNEDEISEAETTKRANAEAAVTEESETETEQEGAE